MVFVPGLEVVHAERAQLPSEGEGWRGSALLQTDHSKRVLFSLLEIQHPSVEAEHSIGAFKDHSDSPLGLLLLLFCLLLPSLLPSQLLIAHSFTKTALLSNSHLLRP